MILETKLTLPQPKAGALLRTGLIEVIKNNLDKKLVLITAGAGYGKTTLLAQLIKQAKPASFFYSIDNSDSDLQTLYSYLLAGLEKLSPGLVSRSAGLLKQGSQIGNNYELLMGTLINELLEKRKEDLFIVLDDYQHLTEDSPVHQALDFFIDHMPESVHVIIASRGTVRFANYAKWFAKQNALEITKEQLAFTKEETRQLLSQSCSRALNEDELKKILKHTEGWIAGIQLIVMRTQVSGQRSTIHETLYEYSSDGSAAMDYSRLFEYFTSAIIASETGMVREFLVKTSILDLLTPEACNSVTDSVDSGKLLKDLEKRNLFISRIGKDGYKYHHLFQDFLQKQMAEDKHDLKALHVKAAGYYEKKGMLVQAIGHYLDAGCYEKASGHIIKAASELGQSGGISILTNWLGQLPENMLNNDPDLLVLKGIYCRIQGHFDEAEAAYATAEQAIRLRQKKHGRRKSDLATLSNVLQARGRMLSLSGQQKKAIRVLRQAQRACPDSYPGLKMEILIPMGLSYQTLGDFRMSKICLERALRLRDNRLDDTVLISAEANLVALQLTQGDIIKAVEQYKSLQARYGNKYFWGVGMLWSNAANAALLLGDADWAEKCLKKSREVCAPHLGDVQSQAALLYSSGLLSMQKAEWDQAVQCLETAHKQFAILKWKTGVIKSRISLGCLYRRRRDILKARAHLDAAAASIDKSDTINTLQLRIEEALLDVDCGQLHRARTAIRAALKKARTIKCRREEFMVCLAQASLCLCLGREKQAGRILAQAAAVSKTKGYEGILVQELRHNRNLANVALKQGMNAGNIDQPETIRLQVKMFGTFQMRLWNGIEAPFECPSRKEVSLLAYLLLNRSRVCHREELIEKIWPGMSLKHAASNLRPAISLLKKCLDQSLGRTNASEFEDNPLIVHLDKGYGLTPSLVCRLDVEEYQNHWHKARALEKEGNTEEAHKEYQDCIDLYADDFLPSQGERWCEEQRDAYEKIYISCLGKLAAYKAANGQLEEAVEIFKKCIKRDPYSENVRTDYWQTLKALGRKDDIRKDYHLLKKMLYRDFKANPQPQTEEYYKKTMFS